MANQFLTSLESFEGICIVSTNSMDRLDPASSRRFDFKIKFGWLKPNQCQLLLEELLESLGIEDDNEEAILHIRKISTLAPGDFAAVARQNRVLGGLKSSVAVVQALEREITFKSAEASGRSIGFL
jgi:SpoVK/Ycf46/Vps4 family AAA+-type ATPase